MVRDPTRLTVTGERLEVFRGPDRRRGTAARARRPGRGAVRARCPHRGDAGATGRLTRTVPAAEGVSASPLGPTTDGYGYGYGYDGYAYGSEVVGRRALRALLRHVLGDVYGDPRRMAADPAAGGADWTVVRPPRLLDEPGTGRCRRAVGGNPPEGRFLARADMAARGTDRLTG